MVEFGYSPGPGPGICHRSKPSQRVPFLTCPNSLNIPFHDLIESNSDKLRSPKETLKIFKDKGISAQHEIVNYCGGGIAATLDAFVQWQLGMDKIQIYDNSMSEWAMNEKLPIEIG